MARLTQADPEQIAAARDVEAFVWLDLHDPDPGALDAAGHALGLHPVALEDSAEFGQRPKLDVYPDQLLLVLYTLGHGAAVEDPAIEVHLHLGPGFLLTIRRSGGERLVLDGMPDPLEDGPALVHRVLLALVDAYEPLVTAIEARVDSLEDEIFRRTRREQLERIYRLRQDLGRHERRIDAQAAFLPAAVEAILALPGFDHPVRAYLDDVVDHLERLAGELRRQREDLHLLTNTYFNANADKLNRAAARLSVLATFFVIGSLVTGFFGQNFGWLVRSIDSRTDFLVFGLGGLALPALLLSIYLYRRRDDWM